jgi:hypothetical protein
VWRTAKTFHFGDLVGIPTKKAALAPEQGARNELQDEAECDHESRVKDGDAGAGNGGEILRIETPYR